MASFISVTFVGSENLSAHENSVGPLLQGIEESKPNIFILAKKLAPSSNRQTAEEGAKTC
jgi:hypothetical protein